MRDAELRREYLRLCRKKPGTLVDTEACFRAFKAGVDYYMSHFKVEEPTFGSLVEAYEAQTELEG